MTSDLDISLLRAFVAVAEAGSFTAAAGMVARSQSAVSQKVRRLEQLVGSSVFDRTSRSLSLTQTGTELLRGARRMLDLNDEIIRSLDAENARGHLRIGLSEGFIPFQLPRLLSRFLQLHPGIHLDINTSLTHDLLSAYDAGHLDLVIAMRQHHDRGRVIWRGPMGWFAAPDFQIDLTRPLPLVLLKPPCTYRELMIATLDTVRQEWIAACTVSSLMGVQAAVAGGLGITLLGRSFVQEKMQILHVPDDWPPLPMAEVVLIGEEAADGSLTRPLVTFLIESLQMPAVIDKAF